MKAPELLSPAGTLKHLRYAFAYGADAVYAGQPRYSLRVRNNEFAKLENLKRGIDEAHEQGKLFFLASNLAPHNNKVKTYLRDLEPVIGLGPDALIMSDPGLIMLVRETWPDVPIHLSVQANVVNYAAVRFWQQVGVTRIILSRELSIKEIAEIREQCPDMEIETFVHGALCIAYSGRCLLSGYISHRDSNQGTCTNTCRWQYKAVEARETETGDIVPVKQYQPERVPVTPDTGFDEPPMFLLEEETRPGQYLPAFEDEHGTYIMNSKDLRAIQHVQELAGIGVHSLKIEGRTKSFYYAARTAQIYRKAIDDAVAGRPFDMGLMEELEGMSNRGFTEGFYRRHLPEEYQNYEKGISTSDKQQFVGEILESKDDRLLIDVKNKFMLGDRLELMSPSGNTHFTLESLENIDGTKIDVAPGSGHRVWVRIPEGDACLTEDNLQWSLLVRYLPSGVV